MASGKNVATSEVVRADQVASASDWRDPLLITKTVAPRLRADTVERVRLVHQLDRAAERGLILISTPPGYGKSTLVAQWLARSERPFAWISIDETENDPMSFFRYVVAAVQSLDSEMCAETSRMLAGGKSISVRTLVTSFINELTLATKPFTLVLDDFHEIHSLEVLDGVKLLLINQPPMLRLLMITRSDPALPLVRMRANGELLELRAADIEFSVAESQELLCGQLKLDLKPEQVEAIHSWAEGWPVGLLLVGQSLQDRPADEIDGVIAHLGSNPQFIEDYLWSEVLERLSPERRLFLLETSTLDQFNVEACEAVIGSARSHELLRSIERENLFLVTVEVSQRWYRYHHLFAEFLQQQLVREVDRGRIEELHRRAAVWYAEHGFGEVAARHAIAGKDWDSVLVLLTSICENLYRQDGIKLALDWLVQVPNEILERAPQLCFHKAWALARLGWTDQSLAPLEIVEREWQATGDELGLAQVAQVRTYIDIIQENLPEGIARCNQALEFLSDSRSQDRARTMLMLGILYTIQGELNRAEEALLQSRKIVERTGDRILQLIQTNSIGITMMRRGKLSAPSALFQTVLASGDEWRDLPIQNASWLMASIYMEWNDLAAATELLERVVLLAENMSAPLHRPRIHRAMAELAWVKGDTDRAFSEISRMLEFCAVTGAHRDMRIAKASQARFWIASDQRVLARGWANSLDLNLNMEPEYPRFREYLVLLTLLSYEDHDDLVVAPIEQSQYRAEQDGRLRDLLDLLLLRTIVEQKLGNPDASEAALEQALDIGAPEGFFNTFIWYGRPLIAPLEHAARQSSAHRDYAIRLLDALGGGTKAMSVLAPAATRTLSARETEVLVLVAVGLANRDIGDALFISEETVKTHLRRIFEKLKVSNRTQAVAKGRELGLC